MKFKTWLAFILLGISGFLVGYLFWMEELKYRQPTPVPADYLPVALNKYIILPQNIENDGKPVFLHFFNPSCPCSRFNVKHFNSLVYKFRAEVVFAVVVPKGADKMYAAELVTEGTEIIEDLTGGWAHACGVYATPQAVILTKDNHLYYKGNYNKARYCTEKNSNYAEIALNSLLKGLPSKDQGSLSTTAYGCEYNKEFTLF